MLPVVFLKAKLLLISCQIIIYLSHIFEFSDKIMPNQVIATHAKVEPVFILSKFLPDKVDVPTMCRAGERVVGSGGIDGGVPDWGTLEDLPFESRR